MPPQASTDVAIGFHQAQDDEGERFRWTTFDQGAPIYFDQFMGRFFYVRLYAVSYTHLTLPTICSV